MGHELTLYGLSNADVNKLMKSKISFTARCVKYDNVNVTFYDSADKDRAIDIIYGTETSVPEYQVMLVIDKPGYCIECPLCREEKLEYTGNFTYKQYYHCFEKPDTKLNKSNLTQARPKWCPLKQLKEET